jgi:hypothetical protein
MTNFAPVNPDSAYSNVSADVENDWQVVSLRPSQRAAR